MTKGRNEGGRHAALRPAYGYSLAEFAVVLVILGIIAAAGSGAFRDLTTANRSQLQSVASLATATGAVLAFARASHRLPCPDVDGSGRESLSAGVCPASHAVGWFPYLALGLPAPVLRERLIYGVHRSSVADLARTEEHGSDTADSPAYADAVDFVQALRLASTEAVSTEHIYLTGDNGRLGAPDCAANVVGNPAFVLVAPGSDRDGDGNLLDGIHATLPQTGRCFAAPTCGSDQAFDDRTQSVSPVELIDKMNSELL